MKTLFLTDSEGNKFYPTGIEAESVDSLYLYDEWEAIIVDGEIYGRRKMGLNYSKPSVEAYFASLKSVDGRNGKRDLYDDDIYTVCSGCGKIVSYMVGTNECYGVGLVILCKECLEDLVRANYSTIRSMVD